MLHLPRAVYSVPLPRLTDFNQPKFIQSEIFTRACHERGVIPCQQLIYKYCGSSNDKKHCLLNYCIYIWSDVIEVRQKLSIRQLNAQDASRHTYAALIRHILKPKCHSLEHYTFTMVRKKRAALFYSYIQRMQFSHFDIFILFQRNVSSFQGEFLHIKCT